MIYRVVKHNLSGGFYCSSISSIPIEIEGIIYYRLIFFNNLSINEDMDFSYLLKQLIDVDDAINLTYLKIYDNVVLCYITKYQYYAYISKFNGVKYSYECAYRSLKIYENIFLTQGVLLDYDITIKAVFDRNYSLISESKIGITSTLIYVIE